MEKYTALLVDIRNSRGYAAASRYEVQSYMRACMGCLNDIFSSSLACEMMFSAGDEIQGLFRFPGAAYLYLRLLRLAMAPVGLRAGIGVGGWETVMTGGVSTEQDGTAYHRAREAIDTVHEEKDRGILLLSDKKRDMALNACLHASEKLVGNCTHNQKMLMLLTEILYPLVQGKAAPACAYRELLQLVWNPARQPSLWKNPQKGRTAVLNWESGVESCPVVVEKALLDKAYVNGSFDVKGLSTTLSGLLGISRQSVEKSVKSAAVYECRELDAAILKMLAQTFGG